MDYKKMWLAFVQVVPDEGYHFADLIDTEGAEAEATYMGAWCNVLVKHEDIKQAIGIIEESLWDKHFVLAFIDKIENIESLVENEELNEDTLADIQQLCNSGQVFTISGSLYPYMEE
jgi:hypothetical protein